MACDIGIKNIPIAADCADELQLPPSMSQLPAQTTDQQIHCALANGIGCATRQLDQLRPGENLVRMAVEHQQQVSLGAGQHHLYAASRV